MMNDTQRCSRISNVFYNRGLEKAQIRDLTGAAECLKKSLQFNKYNTDARNLLGLICYEVGETAQALLQWVVSSNLQPEHNRASYYLHEIQGSPGRLEDESVHIRRYNQALVQAQNDNAQLAILQLRRVVEHKPNYIQAHMLLALLYMGQEDYGKAGKSLYKVLQIDRNNPRASWYMSIVKKNTGRADVEKRKLKNAFSHHQMEDDDIILPPSYKENTGWQTILHIVAGLAIGAAFVFFLIMPSQEEKLNESHNQEINGVLEQLNQKNMDIDSLTKERDAFREERDEAQGRLSEIEEENGGIIRQYQQLVQILRAYRLDDFETAVQLYSDLDGTQITDGPMQAIIGEIREDMEESGYQVLADLGSRARDEGDPDQAIAWYQKSLAIRPDNPQVLYDMAMVYQGKGEDDTANELFGQIIMSDPDSELAQQARTARGY